MKPTVFHPHVFALLACSLGASAQAQAQAQAPAASPIKGGTLVMPVHVGEPATYDCHGTNSPAVMWRVAPHYSTLLKINADNFPQVTGDLAKSWTVSPDNLSYRFTLHSNVKFHDGSTLTSADSLGSSAFSRSVRLRARISPSIDMAR